MIEHGGLLRVVSFTRPIKGSGHVYRIYPQICSNGRRLGFSYTKHSSSILGYDNPRVAIAESNSIHPM